VTLRSSGNLGMSEKKKIRARRSEAEEADSSVVLSHFRVFFWGASAAVSGLTPYAEVGCRPRCRR